MTAFNEADHPRDPRGQFATKGGATSSGVSLEVEPYTAKDNAVLSQEETTDYIYEVYGGEDPKYIKFIKSRTSVGVRVDGDVVLITKAQISTQMWIPEYGHDFEEKNVLAAQAQKSKEYFIEKNLLDHGNTRKIEKLDEFLNNPTPGASRYVPLKYDNLGREHGVTMVHSGDYLDNPLGRYDSYEVLTPEGAAAYRDGLVQADEKYRKRLETWWKRYGQTHFRVDTFWGDR